MKRPAPSTLWLALSVTLWATLLVLGIMVSPAFTAAAIPAGIVAGWLIGGKHLELKERRRERRRELASKLTQPSAPPAMSQVDHAVADLEVPLLDVVLAAEAEAEAGHPIPYEPPQPKPSPTLADAYAELGRVDALIRERAAAGVRAQLTTGQRIRHIGGDSNNVTVTDGSRVTVTGSHNHVLIRTGGTLASVTGSHNAVGLVDDATADGAVVQGDGNIIALNHGATAHNIVILGARCTLQLDGQSRADAHSVQGPGSRVVDNRAPVTATIRDWNGEIVAEVRG